MPLEETNHFLVDIFRQLAAQSRQAFTQSSMSPIASQFFAQASQMSAQIPQSAL
jgi:hypothetical protein